MFGARGARAAALTVSAAVLLGGCAGAGGSATAARPAASGPASSSAPAGLPAGVSPLGSAVPIASQGWTLSLSPFQQSTPGASDQAVPAGWTVLRTKATFTNTGSQIALLPTTVLTVRYGALGRAAAPVKDSTLTGLPAADAGVKELPGTSFTADVGVAVPPQALGQRITVTAAATEAGMAQPDNVFYEGTAPGQPSSGDSAPPAPASGSSAPVLAFGAWSPSGLRVSPITLGATADGSRQASLDLSLANTDAQPLQGIGITLQIMTGSGLTQAATVNAGLDYPDAAIAPDRTATVTVNFKLPATAVPGQVTVEAVAPDSTRTNFSGTVG